MTVELEREVGQRLVPRVGDRIAFDGPTDDDASPPTDVWDRRRFGQSLVIEVAGGWCHAVELGAGTWEAWSGRVEDVKVIGRALYTDDARRRAVEWIELRADNARLAGEVAMLREQAVESEYRRELAEAVAREMTEQYPPKLFLPGDAEPARAEPIGPAKIVLRNAVFALGTGFVYRQMHEDEWYAAHLSSSVFSWEQVLGDGPCIEVQNPAGVGRLFDVLTEHRQRERDTMSALWGLEQSCDTYDREHGLEVPRDREQAGSPAEMRAIVARATTIMVRLSSRLRAALR